MNYLSSPAVTSLFLDFFSSIKPSGITTMEELKQKVLLVDDWYSPISKDELLTICRDNPLFHQPGEPKTQITDCDDYALQLKMAAMAKSRNRFFLGTAAPVPPAVAIVFSQNHALNVFVEQDRQGNNSLWFIDPSTPELPPTNDPEEAIRMMKQSPVKCIQM